MTAVVVNDNVNNSMILKNMIHISLQGISNHTTFISKQPFPYAQGILGITLPSCKYKLYLKK